jgi:hypothetical protein
VLLPSNPLPQAGLLVEAIQLDAAEVQPRHDPYDPALIDNRQMPVPPVLHQPQCFDRHLAWRHRVGIGGHDIGQGRASRTFSFCEHPVNGIAAGENTDQTAIAVR